MTNYERLQQGLIYNDFDEELFVRRVEAKKLFKAYNKTEDDEIQHRQELLEKLFCSIGKNVWLGGDVKILPGVTIHDNSIIGTGSIVTKDIPENVIAVGNPCKVIRKITEKDKTDYMNLIKE